jgi:hypothetical protein
MPKRRNNYQPPVYLSFDGAANSYVSLASADVVPDATAALSGAVWVFLRPLGTGSTDSIRDIIGNRRDSVTAGWVFKISNRAKDKIELSFYDQNSSSQGWISNVTVPSYRWTHIGFTFDGTQVIFYIDGNPDPKETVGVPKTIKMYADQNIRIGHRQAAGSTFETFAGKMAGLALWNRKLTAQEFLDMYHKRVIPQSGLLAHWPMDEGSGATVADAVGDNDGTIVGGVTWGTDPLNTGRSSASARALAQSRLAAIRSAV